MHVYWCRARKVGDTVVESQTLFYCGDLKEVLREKSRAEQLMVVKFPCSEGWTEHQLNYSMCEEWTPDKSGKAV